MKYKIIVDSCCDFAEEMKGKDCFQAVPLELTVDGVTVVDDETFDQAKFLEMVRKSQECPKSACPSPELYKQAYECGAEHIYVVTLSHNLSGSYNSARLGMEMFLEENKDTKIHIFSSCSAASGETMLALEIWRMEEEGRSFEEIVDYIEDWIAKGETLFVLENLDTLRKNGRLTGIKSFLASALNIKPIMSRTREGTICQIDQARGTEKAMSKLMDYVIKAGKESGRKLVAISYCNCKDRALKIKEALEKEGIFNKIYIMDTAGVSTMYANDGGIVISL